MNHSEIWSAPKSDAMLAAFHIDENGLTPCETFEGTDHNERAERTLSVWEASQHLPGAAMLVVKSDNATSLGLRNGGIIIEGRDKLNVGMMRASTRSLAARETALGSVPLVTSDDRFRRAFLSILSRLEATVMPRCYGIFLDGVEGEIHVSNGELRFVGDFLTPANFVDELRAACEVGEGIRYTLLENDKQPDVTAYALSDLIAEVAQEQSDESYRFEADGWPVHCSDMQSADLILCMSGIAAAGSRMEQHSKPCSIMVLSEDNRPLITGKIDADGGVEFRIGQMSA